MRTLRMIAWGLCWGIVILIVLWQVQAASNHLASKGYPVAAARSDTSDIYAQFSQNPHHQQPIETIKSFAEERGRVQGFIIENVYNASQTGHTTVEVIVYRESPYLERVVFETDGRIREITHEPYQP